MEKINVKRRNPCDFIVCIRCKGDLKKDESYLICNKCKIKYPIKNSIPHMLEEYIIAIDEE